MKKLILISNIVIILLLLFFFVDRKCYMHSRIKEHLWTFEKGDFFLGDFIHSDSYVFKEDTMIFANNKKALVKYQFFNTLIVEDVYHKKRGVYKIKGMNWYDSLKDKF